MPTSYYLAGESTQSTVTPLASTSNISLSPVAQRLPNPIPMPYYLAGGSTQSTVTPLAGTSNISLSPLASADDPG